MVQIISIATANTYGGQLLLHPDGLKPFIEARADILLLQEAFGLTYLAIEERLGDFGYGVAYVHPTAGLAIALRKDSGLKVVPDSGRFDPYVWRSHAGIIAHKYSRFIESRFRPRGILSVDLTAKNGDRFAVATTHMSVFARHQARGRQLQSLAKVLNSNEFTRRPLILGADMNHYPRAGKRDLGLHASSGLELAAITEPTWSIRGSKHEWLGRIGARAARRPLDSFDAHLDALLYRGETLKLLETKVVSIESDHRAIFGIFNLGR